MTIKQLGGVFGRNPTFNDVTIEGELTFDGDIDVNSDLTVDGDLEVTGPDGRSITLKNTNGGAATGDLIGQVLFYGSDASSPGAGVKSKFKVITDGGSADGSKILISTSDGVTNDIDRMEFTKDGDVKVLTGNLVIGTSGKGIDFSATSGTGTSELLDDYEEGTFTPSYNTSNSDANVAYASQDGKYTKIGDVVYVEIYLVISSVTSTGSGNIYIEDLPFVAQTGSKAKFTISTYGVNFDAVNFYSLTASAISNNDKLSILGIQDNAAWAGTSPSNFVVSSGSRIVINGFYFV